MMPIKMGGLGFLNPVMSSNEKYLSSQLGSSELIRAMMGEGHSPMPTTYGLLGNKSVKGRNTGKSQTKPNSRV